MRRSVIAGALCVMAVVATAAVAGIASVKPYAVGTGQGYATTPLLSVGDTVPETSDPTKSYQMVGIPDGLGAHRTGPNVTVFMNHEFGFTAQSEPVLGEPLNRGAIVSKWTIAPNGTVVSGERAYDTVYLGETLVGPAAVVGNSTRAFARFCSGSLAGPAEGFDRWIFFANEEADGANTFDGKGGLSVAVFDNKAYGLPDLGHFAWEQTIAQPQPAGGSRVVLIGMEDGPSDMEPTKSNSQVYMYVGTKDPSSASPLRKNGLVGGKLYVLAPANKTKDSEVAFGSGTLAVQWVEIPQAGDLTDVQLEAAADAAGAFRFARPEDAAWNDANRNQLVFVTTGEARVDGAVADGVNRLGRVYELDLNPADVTKAGRLRVAVNADDVVAAGGDTALSPDNIDVGQGYLMVNEDGTTTSRAAMSDLGRDGSVWRFDVTKQGVDGTSAKRVAVLDPPGRTGQAISKGVWETSGIIDTSDLLGASSWLFVVQGHNQSQPAPAPPGVNTVEDGQLLILRATNP